eukprot:TRINITY_DN68184_c5_g3_i1.p1 TRINITY_DN68184_c5_g3~~TRINITY_DN68184_c5_g3_i1.p1  ORF type:complete len:625 (-),score=51.80 TRINITY_DN68184_c5_g3_i1:116-1828(-)
MHKLVPFIQDILGVTSLPSTPSLTLKEAIDLMPPPIKQEDFWSEIRLRLQSHQVTMDPEARLCHSVGKNYRDLWRLRNGMVERPPDCVVYPQSHSDCEVLMRAAVKCNVCIIPFGGGTNVVGAVEPDPFETKRMICSVDMRRMNKMLSVSVHSQTATFEAGTLGPQIEQQLQPHGLTLGHDPDSFQHSTLGGWIGARSSGAASNKYGELEQMVISLKIVTPVGTILTPGQPRAVGPSLNDFFIGSEGVFGIITEATIKAQKIPPFCYYEGWLMPSFAVSVEASYQATQDEAAPAILRCYDQDETQLSFATQFRKSPLMEHVSKGIKGYLQHWKKFDMNQVSLVIVGYEGTKTKVKQQRAAMKKILKEHDGFCAGSTAGNNWQAKKYDLPLLRDFCLTNGLWADVLETCVTWENAMPCWEAVKIAVRDHWESRGKKGFIGCHAAHQYQTGTCLYYTFASTQEDKGDISIFLELKKAATEALLCHHGALTHHHGVGYEHVPWVDRFYGAGGMSMLHSVKHALDPTGICNPGKLLPVDVDKEADPTMSEAKKREIQEKRMMFTRMGVLPESKL